MRTHPRRSPIPYLPILLGFLLLNTIVLDGVVLWQMRTGDDVLGVTTGEPCPSACIARINQLSGKSGGTAKEFFIPLGSGTGNDDNWADVSGANASIDTASYAKIKRATFEATVSQPAVSQRIWLRLFNATDKHPVWFSEITTEDTNPVTLVSPAITLDSGNKLYQVQLKTQLRGQTTVTQSRIRITTY